MKNYIEVNGLKCHWNFKLLSKDFIAITLFGHVFFRMSKEELEEYLKTIRGRWTINHERIHTLQAKSFKTKYLGFYLYYIWYWIKGLCKYGFINEFKHHTAYYNLPFEAEAFSKEVDFDYDESKWRNYI